MARVLRAFLVVVLCVAAYCKLSEGLKMPFRPKDFLLMLSHQVSCLVLNTIHNAVDLLPLFVGSVSDQEIVQWNGSCIDGNEARIEYTEKEGDELGGFCAIWQVEDSEFGSEYRQMV